MESGRFMLAIVLMIATVVLVNVIFPPQRPAPGTPADSAALLAGDSLPVAPAADSVHTPVPAAVVPAQDTAAAVITLSADPIIVESSLYRYAISALGAGIVSAELIERNGEDFKYRSFTRPGPVQLAPATGKPLVSHRLRIDGRDVDLAGVPFTTDRKYVRVDSASGPDTVRLTGTHPATGRTIELTYAFNPVDYQIDVSARITPAGGAAQLVLDIGPRLALNEANATEDERALAYVVNSRQNGISSVILQSVRNRVDRQGRNIDGTRVEEGPLEWIALKNKYFLLAAIPQSSEGDAAFGGLTARDAPGRHAADLSANLLFGQDQTASYKLYLGPQEYDRQVALGLQDVNPMGWRWLRPIVRPLGHAFTWILLSTHRATGMGYGWVLILFGIAVRLALWPLNAKAMRSQMKNMELQPRIKDIQTRYKQNPEQMQKEMLKLYREEGFNPMGGCLPLLLPMPVLITLFFVFQSTIEFRGASFLWLPDLSLHDPLFVLPILLGITMFLQQWLSAKSSPPNPQMQMMMWFMPAFMVVIFFRFASGLNLYYAAQNLASIPQQLQLNRERQRYQATRPAAVVTPAPAGRKR